MLRLYLDRVRIYLHPEQVVLVRESGFFKRRVVKKLMITDFTQGEQPWNGALAALGIALQHKDWQQARASVVLSGQLLRYRIVPWDARLMPEEREALLRYQLQELYGDDMRNSTLSIADVGFGKQSVACAVDARLIEAIKNVFSSVRLSLASVTPYLMTAFNQWRKEINGEGAWLILAEKSRLTVALVGNGEWRGVRSQVCEAGWEANLALLLQREALQLGVDANAYPVYFFWPQQPNFKPDLPNAVQLLHLPTRVGFSCEDKDVALALCGWRGF